MSRTILAAIVLVATGCAESTVACPDGCAAPFAHEQGRQAPFGSGPVTVAHADEGFALVAGSVDVEGLVLVAEVRHPVGCTAPDLEVSVQSWTTAIPSTGRGMAEVFATSECVADAGEGEMVSAVAVDLAPIVAGRGCVGELVLELPRATDGESGAIAFPLDAGCADIDQPLIVAE